MESELINIEWWNNLPTEWKDLFIKHCDNIKDIDLILKKIPELKTFSTNGKSKISSLIPLKYCKSLEVLWCKKEPLISLIGIEHLTNLTELHCYCCCISDLSPIKNLYKLRLLNAWNNNITCIEVLKNLINLEEIYLSDNIINDISPIDNLPKLKNFIND